MVYCYLDFCLSSTVKARAFRCRWKVLPVAADSSGSVTNANEKEMAATRCRYLSSFGTNLVPILAEIAASCVCCANCLISIPSSESVPFKVSTLSSTCLKRLRSSIFSSVRSVVDDDVSTAGTVVVETSDDVAGLAIDDDASVAGTVENASGTADTADDSAVYTAGFFPLRLRFLELSAGTAAGVVGADAVGASVIVPDTAEADGATGTVADAEDSVIAAVDVVSDTADADDVVEIVPDVEDSGIVTVDVDAEDSGTAALDYSCR